MYIGLDRDFTGTKYTYNQVFIGKSGTAADIKSTCGGKTFTMRFTIRKPLSGDLPISTQPRYLAEERIACSEPLPAAAGWPTGDPQITLGPSIVCRNETRPSIPTFGLNGIDVADTTDVIGFELGN
jgi:hypothetical protein